MGKFSSFLDKMAKVTVKRNVLIGVVILIIALASVAGLFFINVNSDLFSYLPAESDTAKGLRFMAEYFKIDANIVVAIEGESTVDGESTGATKEEIGAIVSEIKQLPNVTAAMWIGDLDGLLPLLGTMGDDVYEKAASIMTDGNNYLIMVMLPVSAASTQTGEVLTEVRRIVDGYNVSTGGTATITQDIYADSLSELPWYIAAAVILVLIILILTARNYVEPIIFLSTLGISILINMGTNIIFKDISIISFCAASVLQLGLAMDYAIFLTHIYYEEKEKGLDTKAALQKALPKTFSTIAASALTTIAGMATLFAMRFTVGGDLAKVIIKGIILALLSVLFLQPCLLLWSRKAMDKTPKKPLNFHFEPIARQGVKKRKVIAVIALLLVVPCFIGQLYLKLNYVSPLLDNQASTELEALASSMNTAIFVSVPIDGTSQQSLDKQYEFVAKLNELKEQNIVSSVTSLFSMLDQRMLGTPTKYSTVTRFASQNEMFRLMVNEGYTIYIVALDKKYAIESDETELALREVRSSLFSVFDEGESVYITGATQGVSDFKATTPRDFLIINILSVVSVFIVLLFTFRSVKYPALLVLLIELGIWINYSINALFGLEMNFVSYLSISAVQLGATVDYAILLAKRYREMRKSGSNPLEAAYEASRSSSMSVLTSASIMTVACLSIGIIASNGIVKEIAFLVARGAVISCLLVLFVLPSLLSCSESLAKFVKDEGGVKGVALAFAKKLKEDSDALKQKLLHPFEKKHGNEAATQDSNTDDKTEESPSPDATDSELPILAKDDAATTLEENKITTDEGNTNQ